MKLLTIFALAALALANPIANDKRADECAATCKTTYMLCYGACNNQLLLAPAPCTRECNIKTCKDVSSAELPHSPFNIGPLSPLKVTRTLLTPVSQEKCMKCKAFATKHCADLPKES